MKLKKILLILGTTGIAFFTLNGSVGALTNSIEASINKSFNNVGDVNHSVFNQMSNGLPTTSTSIFTFEDNKNNIWAGMSSGLYESKDGGKTFAIVANQVFDGLQVLSMGQDAHSIYWVGTNQGLYRADAAGITFTLITQGFAKPKLVINFVYSASDAWLYIGTNEGLYRKGIEGSNFPIVPSMNATHNVLSISQSIGGYFWLCTTGAAGFFVAPQGYTWTFKRQEIKNVTNLHPSLTSPGSMWIWNPSSSVMSRLTITSRNLVNGYSATMRNGLRAKSIVTVPGVNGWLIATQTGALYQLIGSVNAGTYTQLTSRIPGSINVNKLFQDNKGSVYAGTVNNGLWLSLNKIYGYDILNRGKEIDIPRKDGSKNQYFNQDITLFSKNDFINNVTINGVDISKTGNWSKTLDGTQNKGAYQVVFHNRIGAVTTLNIFITKGVSSDDFNYTSSNNNTYDFNAQYNWGKQNINYIFVRVNDAKRNDSVMFKFHEIMDTTSANTYYQKFLGFNKTDGSLKVAPEKIPFTTDPKGIGNSYVLTLTNKFGTKVKYFLQIANPYDNPIMNKESNIPDGGGKWLPAIPNSNENKKNNLAAIIVGSVGGVVFLSLLIGTALYLKKRKDGLSKKNSSEKS